MQGHRQDPYQWHQWWKIDGVASAIPMWRPIVKGGRRDGMRSYTLPRKCTALKELEGPSLSGRAAIAGEAATQQVGLIRGLQGGQVVSAVASQLVPRRLGPCVAGSGGCHV
jgi:hypothetical protein